MAVTYTPTTNFGAKDSLPQNDPDKVIKGSEFTTEFTAIQTAFSLAATAASPTFTGTATLPSVDINGGTIDGTSIGASSKSSGAFTSLEVFATSPSLLLTETDITDKNTKLVNGGGNFFIQEISNDGLTSVNRIKLDHTTGNMTFYDDTSAGTVLFLDAVNNRAGINTINPASTLDVNGTVTADGLTVDGTATFNTGSGTADNVVITGTDAGGSTAPDLVIYRNSASPVDGDNIGMVQFRGNNDAAGAVNYAAIYASINDASSTTEDGKLSFAVATANTEAPSAGTTFMTIDGGGDISFYEDTGTTPKFFWDASAEALGIGTTSPVGGVHSQTASAGVNANSNFRQFVAENSGNAGITILSGASSLGTLVFGDSGSSTVGRVQYDHSNDSLAFSNNNSERMRIDSSGNVGIGTSSPSAKFVVTDNSTKNVEIGWDSSSSAMRILSFDRSGAVNVPLELRAQDIRFETDTGGTGSERMRIDSAGNVGIGTSSPATRLELSGVKDTSELRLSSTTNDASWAANQYFGKLSFYSADSSGAGAGIKGSIVSACTGGSSGATAHMAFSVASTTTNEVEAMRIDSSGNLLVGGTSAFGADTITLAPGGFAAIRNTSGSALELRRDSTDGSILDFQKDGTTVGSVGYNIGALTVDGAASRSGLYFGNGAILPRYDGSLTNGTNADLGTSSQRFENLYLSGGVYLGGTGAANKLNDYEEGTWTPTVTVTAGPTVGASPSYAGAYTKIGNMVYCRVYLSFDDSVTAPSLDDRISIGGLPFTPDALAIIGTGTAWLYGTFGSGHNAFFDGGIDDSNYYIYCTRVSGTNARYNDPVRAEFAYRVA